MKLHKWIFVLSCAGMLSSCTDNSYQGEENLSWMSDDAMPVILRVGDPDDVIVSKGTGAVDNDDSESWNNASIYVYAFKRDLYTSFSTTSMEDSEWCLVDGSKDELDNTGGKRARVGRLDSYVTWEGVERAIYYPPGNQPYDFYAYYIDDIEMTPDKISRTDDAVRLQVEIDGARDLMSAKAELTEDQLYREGFTDEDRFNIMNYAYSSYTAQLDIQPVVYFKHHLTRLRFVIYPGRKEADNIYVESVKVYSRTKGVFTVASKAGDDMGVDFSADNVYKELELKETDGSDMPKDKYHTVWEEGFDGKDVYERKGVLVGGSLLVAPDTEYKVVMQVKEWKGDRPYTYLYTMNNLTSGNGDFKAGNQYTVRIAFYGMMEMTARVDAVPWGYGGEIIIDEDKPPVSE